MGRYIPFAPRNSRGKGVVWCKAKKCSRTNGKASKQATFAHVTAGKRREWYKGKNALAPTVQVGRYIPFAPIITIKAETYI